MPNDALYRLSCHAHFITRAKQRGINVAACDIARIEGVIEKARHLLSPGRDGRCLVSIKARGENLRIVYDARRSCIVSVWNGSPRFSL